MSEIFAAWIDLQFGNDVDTPVSESQGLVGVAAGKHAVIHANFWASLNDVWRLSASDRKFMKKGQICRKNMWCNLWHVKVAMPGDTAPMKTAIAVGLAADFFSLFYFV